MNKFIFCFPYYDVGGVPVLFLRLAEELGRRGLQTSIVDYREGYMAQRYNPNLTQLLEYSDDGTLTLPPNSILILQAMTPWSIFPGLNILPETRLFFWNCHPFNLVPTLPGLRRRMQSDARFGSLMLATVLRHYRSLMRRFVRKLLERNALVFMDFTNISTTETYLVISIQKPEMLAIPAQHMSDKPHTAPLQRSTGLRLAWIGRLVDFKYFPLINALCALNQMQPSLGIPIAFDVIGGGDYEMRLRNDVKALNHLEVKFHGEMEPTALQQHLSQATDVLFAMGTSALEGARLGVPTILLDLSYCRVPKGYQFSWLHERDGYSLADVAYGSSQDDAGMSLYVRLKQVMETGTVISMTSKNYFRQHHEIDAVADKLVDLVNRSHCTYGDLLSRSLVGRGLFYSVFKAIRKGVGR